MYFTPRAAQVRNLSVAAVNGIVTLIILLIAPLGLAAVIINTLLVTVATYITATAGDRIIQYLMGDRTPKNLGQPQQIDLLDHSESSLDRPRNNIDREQQ